MTEQVQTTDRFRNISGHLEDLTGGKMVEAGGFVDLTAEEQNDDFNSAKLSSSFIRVGEPKADPPPYADASHKELLARAGELNIEGRGGMRSDQLREAIVAAEQNQNGGTD